MTNSTKTETVINLLNEMDVDGETIQYIVEQVGMDQQLLRQLIMTRPTQESFDLLEERYELDDERE